MIKSIYLPFPFLYISKFMDKDSVKIDSLMIAQTEWGLWEAMEGIRLKLPAVLSRAK